MYKMTTNVTSKKRNKRNRESEDDEETCFNEKEYSLPPNVSRHLYSDLHPPGLDRDFAAAIFELGLKHASPKILIPLMPTDCDLSTEHIKSHLQKYRIHRQRSKDEFCAFYDKYISDSFASWEANRSWDKALNNHSASPPSVRGSNSSKMEENHFTTVSSSNSQLVSKLQNLQLIKKCLLESIKSATEWKAHGLTVATESGRVANEIKSGLEEAFSIDDT